MIAGVGGRTAKLPRSSSKFGGQRHLRPGVSAVDRPGTAAITTADRSHLRRPAGHFLTNRCVDGSVPAIGDVDTATHQAPATPPGVVDGYLRWN